MININEMRKVYNRGNQYAMREAVKTALFTGAVSGMVAGGFMGVMIGKLLGDSWGVIFFIIAILVSAAVAVIRALQDEQRSQRQKRRSAYEEKKQKREFKKKWPTGHMQFEINTTSCPEGWEVVDQEEYPGQLKEVSLPLEWDCGMKKGVLSVRTKKMPDGKLSEFLQSNADKVLPLSVMNFMGKNAGLIPSSVKYNKLTLCLGTVLKSQEGKIGFAFIEDNGEIGVALIEDNGEIGADFLDACGGARVMLLPE